MPNAVRPKLNGVTVRAVEDELLLLDRNTQRIHQLNRTASFIWRCCGETASQEEIASQLAARYAVDEAVALKDVADTLRRLLELRLVVEA
jgi:hypothetical protein